LVSRAIIAPSCGFAFGGFFAGAGHPGGIFLASFGGNELDCGCMVFPFARRRQSKRANFASAGSQRPAFRVSREPSAVRGRLQLHSHERVWVAKAIHDPAVRTPQAKTRR